MRLSRYQNSQLISIHLYDIKLFSLLLTNLLTLHFSNALALPDLLNGTLAWKHHCRGQVGEVGKERGGSQSGILLEDHARTQTESIPIHDKKDEIDTYSMMTRAAMVSTIGTARGTTQGSCRPLAANTPSEPSYLAVDCS